MPTINDYTTREIEVMRKLLEENGFNPDNLEDYVCDLEFISTTEGRASGRPIAWLMWSDGNNLHDVARYCDGEDTKLTAEEMEEEL